MIGSVKRIWPAVAVTFAVALVSPAQDGVDEDSLLAMEEMTLTDAVEGDLPVADDSGGDDLLAELLAGDDMPLDDLATDEATTLESVNLDDDDLGDLDLTLEELPDDDLAEAIDSDESDMSLDDLLGAMAGEEPTAESVPAVDAAPLEEKGLDAMLDSEEIALPDMPETVEEPPVADATDLDALIDELADEPEPELDMGALMEEIPETVETPEPVVEMPPPAMVEIVEEPEPEGYVDDMALDAELFGSLLDEARTDLAAGEGSESEIHAEDPIASAETPEPIDDVVEMLVEEAETDLGVVPEIELLPEPPTVEPVPAPIAEAGAVELAEIEPELEPEAVVVGKSASVAAFETAERLKRIAGEAHALESIQNAEKELAEKNYLGSIILFEEALEYLPRRADLVGTRKRARRGLGGAFYLRALSLERMNELEKAKAAALNAVKYGYSRAEGAVKRIQATMDAPPPELTPIPKDRWEMPDYVLIENEIAAWLKRGRQAYLTGEYERAILGFESVLARDPENKEAMRLMHSAAQKQYDRASSELDATRTRMMATVRDTWNPRQYGLHEAPTDSKIGQTTTTGTEDLKRKLIVEKMTQIRIPEVDFRQANIRDVVDFLHQQSVEFDPSHDPQQRKGVNIILKLDDDGGERTPVESHDPFAAPDAAFGGGKGGGDQTLVTFSALDITLKEALDIVIDVAGLKYRIRGSVIIILPKNAAEGEIEHRMYDVLSTAITRLQDLAGAVTASSRQSSGDFLALESSGVGIGEEVDLKAFFTEMGVEWPDGSSIKFVRGLGKLVVANTLENLTVFEKVLSILNVVPYQIEIEARFVEVAQTDVDSLGLEWLLDDNWEILEKKSSAGLPLGARERIVMNANSGSGGFTAANRFLNVAGVGGASIADDLLSLSAVLTNPEMSVILHALQQRGHTDLLSAPKITTQSGQAATIKVVTEYIYPTEFETEGISGNNNNNVGNQSAQGGVVGAVVTPGSFETREVGVILEVMPEVSPEGQMINLSLSPEVVSEPTWKNYGSSYTSYDPNGNAVTQELNMEQPFFHTRHLQTNLLIYNGATVVMGGMITEVRQDVDDKIPILGDIPILGRLFRSRYESSEKRNLLIFVTARLVDPSGRALDRERFGVDTSIAERIVADDGEGDSTD